MNQLVKRNSILAMSSLEIAELTKKRHDNVIVDIENMLFDLGLHAPDFSGTYKTSQGNEDKCYNLPRRETEILITGYDVNRRAAVIDRWYALETGAVAPALTSAPSTIAKTILQDNLDVAALFGVPLHFAQTEAVKQARLLTGHDYSHLLLAAPAQDDIKEEEKMLEPTELANLLGFKSAIALNRKLCEAGWQEKEGQWWQATDRGARHCVNHQWFSGGKTGYNLKWNVKAVQKLLDK